MRLFPRFLWQQLLHKAVSELAPDAYDYAGPQGMPELRNEIAAWLFRSRGLTVDPQDIFITAGATHALHLIADLLCRDGRHILMEDPCHSGMLQTLSIKAAGSFRCLWTIMAFKRSCWRTGKMPEPLM